MNKNKLVVPLSNLKKRGRALGIIGIVFFSLLIIILALYVSSENKKNENLSELNQKVLREEEILKSINESNDNISNKIDSLVETLDTLGGNN